jgi:hypothetical protein
MIVSWRIAVLVLALLFLTGCQPRKTGIFSTLDMDKTGLIFGYEIFILKGDRAEGAESDYYAIVQCANGKVSPPLTGQVKMESDQVTITIPFNVELGCPSSQFIGTVGFKELVGKFGNGKELRLPRKDSFWE